MKDLTKTVQKDVQGEFIVKSVDVEKRTIVAYGSSFGTVDSHNDRVLKGAFSESISTKKGQILFLNAHNRYDTTNILGVISEIKEDDFGLLFEVQIADTQKGNDILELYKAGVPLQHSIGGNYIEGGFKFNETDGVWDITKFDLSEISVVPFGSNSKTPLVTIKEEEDSTVLGALKQENEKLLNEIQKLKNEILINQIKQIN